MTNFKTYEIKKVAEEELKDYEQHYEYCKICAMNDSKGVFAGFLWACTDYKGEVTSAEKQYNNNGKIQTKTFYTFIPTKDAIRIVDTIMKKRLLELKNKGYARIGQHYIGYQTRKKK